MGLAQIKNIRLKIGFTVIPESLNRVSTSRYQVWQSVGNLNDRTFKQTMTKVVYVANCTFTN